jgi:flagellar basal-body rod modification protein FlgD
MSLVAPIEDGKVVETDSQNSLKKANTSKNGMDKDAFLQLLVAQMQYQDPLEPTSNTEFVSQYAQFSQVEQMQNLAATSEMARASSLVGQEVYVKTTTSSGDSKYIYGKVDYVVFEGNKAYLAINEELYALDDLDTVVDAEYKAAYDKAYNFTKDLNKLPKVTSIDLSYEEEIEELKKIYEGMNDYEKSFLAEDTVKRYEEYLKRLEEVRNAAENQKPEKPEGEEGEGSGDSGEGEDSGTNTEGSEGTDET